MGKSDKNAHSRKTAGSGNGSRSHSRKAAGSGSGSRSQGRKKASAGKKAVTAGRSQNKKKITRGTKAASVGRSRDRKKTSSGRTHTRSRASSAKKTARNKQIRQRVRTVILVLAVVIVALSVAVGASRNREQKQEIPKEAVYKVSSSVLEYETLIDQYASQYGVADYKEYLLAIMEVESGGITSGDVMQSSESAGLPMDTLSEEASVRQGCAHFSECLQAAKEQGCDLKTVIQSYNYGTGFVSYVAENGGVYTFELAEAFAKEQAEGVTAEYDEKIAVEANGGWRYAYGNMFYVPLVEQYVTIIRELE